MGAHPLVPPGMYAPLVVEWCLLALILILSLGSPVRVAALLLLAEGG